MTESPTLLSRANVAVWCSTVRNRRQYTTSVTLTICAIYFTPFILRNKSLNKLFLCGIIQRTHKRPEIKSLIKVSVKISIRGPFANGNLVVNKWQIDVKNLLVKLMRNKSKSLSWSLINITSQAGEVLWLSSQTFFVQVLSLCLNVTFECYI